jgi:mannose-6-phosphate isomerase-like protein (cupin superfamily)
MRIVMALASSLLIAATGAGQTAAPQTGAPQTGAPQTGAAQAAPRRAAATSATLVIMVTDPGGAPLGNVKVSVTALAARGATAARDSRTEAGRLTFENLPPGGYRLRFDREGFIPLERELTARGGAPIDVSVTLTPAPPPPAPPPAPAPAPPPAPEPALSPDPISIDMTAFIEKNYIRRGESKVTQLTCTTGGPALLLQVKEGIADAARPDADEFLYVIAGEGIARVAGHDQALRAGTFMMVPRGVARTVAAAGKSPLMLLSVRAGEKCSR